MKIYKEFNKKGDKIIFEIPAKTARCNPYMDKKEQSGTHDTLIGMKSHDKEEMGWARVIDMEYKGKDDQYTDFLIHWWGSEEEFDAICKDIEVGVVML